MALSDSKLKRWYREYNRKWFDGKLPDNTIVWWEHVDNCCAIVEYDGCGVHFDDTSDTFMIRINPALAWSSRLARFSLLHEMAHIAVGIKYQHRAKFHAYMMSLAACGAFKNLW